MWSCAQRESAALLPPSPSEGFVTAPGRKHPRNHYEAPQKSSHRILRLMYISMIQIIESGLCSGIRLMLLNLHFTWHLAIRYYKIFVYNHIMSNSLYWYALCHDGKLACNYLQQNSMIEYVSGPLVVNWGQPAVHRQSKIQGPCRIAEYITKHFVHFIWDSIECWITSSLRFFPGSYNRDRPWLCQAFNYYIQSFRVLFAIFTDFNNWNLLPETRSLARLRQHRIVIKFVWLKSEPPKQQSADEIKQGKEEGNEKFLGTCRTEKFVKSWCRKCVVALVFWNPVVIFLTVPIHFHPRHVDRKIYNQSCYRLSFLEACNFKNGDNIDRGSLKKADWCF